MSESDTSFVLLSSMSPRFRGSKTPKKIAAPHKLSLKKNFRKSIGFDSKPHSHNLNDSSVIIIRDSLSHEAPLSKKKVRILTAPIIISSSSESDNAPQIDYRVDLGAKYDEINNWLADNEQQDSYSEVSSFKRTSLSDTDNEILNSPINKPLDNGKQWEVVAIESKDGREELRDDIIDDSLEELNKTAEDLLDELYGQSWRAKKDLILTRSEPRNPKKHTPIRMPKTERKPRKHDPKSTWAYRLNDLVDSDSESKPSLNSSCNESESNINRVNTKMVTKSHRIEKQLSFNDSDSDNNGKIVRKKAKELSVTKKKAEDTKTNTKLQNAADQQKCYSFLKSLSGCVPSWLCHEEARLYKSNYKSSREKLAKKLFDLYNREIFNGAIPNDTELQWNDKIRGSAGFCYNKRITKSNGTILRSCRIVLANKVLDTADRLRDTLVHEMCHAATWLVNNVSDGHGPYWKSWAHKAMKVFPELPQIKRCHDYQINTKYTYKCVDCGYSIGRHSKSLDMERKRCGYCYGKFEVFINKINKNGEKQCRPTTPKGKPTGFALFVKENYSTVKRDDLKHGDVMKLLGRQFSAMKIAKKL